MHRLMGAPRPRPSPTCCQLSRSRASSCTAGACRPRRPGELPLLLLPATVASPGPSPCCCRCCQSAAGSSLSPPTTPPHPLRLLPSSLSLLLPLLPSPPPLLWPSAASHPPSLLPLLPPSAASAEREANSREERKPQSSSPAHTLARIMSSAPSWRHSRRSGAGGGQFGQRGGRQQVGNPGRRRQRVALVYRCSCEGRVHAPSGAGQVLAATRRADRRR